MKMLLAGIRAWIIQFVELSLLILFMPGLKVSLEIRWDIYFTPWGALTATLGTL